MQEHLIPGGYGACSRLALINEINYLRQEVRSSDRERWPANCPLSYPCGTCRHFIPLIRDQLVIKTWVPGARHLLHSRRNDRMSTHEAQGHNGQWETL